VLFRSLSLFEGLVEYYRATGDPKWLTAVENLYHNEREQEITIIGNGGGDQPYHPYVLGEAWDNTAVEQANPDMTRMMETCTGVTWMKYCSQMLRLTGDPSTVDEIEKYIYNGLLGAMKPTGDGFSYVNLLIGQKVNDQGWGWLFGDLHVTCCNLNGPMGLAYIPYLAVMNSTSGPVVNLYNAATADITTPLGNPLALEIDTRFPFSEKVVLKVNPSQPESFTFKLRIPAWSANTLLRINGKNHPGVSGTYADITREWRPGDRIELVFDFQTRLLTSQHGSNPKADNRQALVYGPLVLTRDENLDKSYNEPVSIKSDKNGFVKITKVKPTLPNTLLEFSVPTTSGGSILMVDYASVDGWNGSKICTWISRQ
jgi:DUF1680 family protein